jgi:hypothetical protein
MAPFRWKNCFADVQASKHDIAIQSYFEDVILPALRTLEERIDDLRRSDMPGHQFAQADMEDVRRETKLAFGLSIQSIWERQIRAYLRGCANELRPGEALAAKVEQANWTQLRKLFRDLRGISLDEFPSFWALDTLHHLGNACRHGDGGSAHELARRCPDLWPAVPPLPPEFSRAQPTVAAVATMDIPVHQLRAFVDAVAAFWNDAEYIYNESIERKHKSLEVRLARDRAQRGWLPQASANGG